eukprot:2906825-Rhodomonas_salina.4
MSGTDLPYQRGGSGSEATARRARVSSYALATRCPVLTLDMLLPGGLVGGSRGALGGCVTDT